MGVLAILGEEPLRNVLVTNADDINDIIDIINEKPTVLDFYSQKVGLENKIQYCLRMCFLRKTFEAEIVTITNVVKASLEIAKIVANSSLFPDELRETTMKLYETMDDEKNFIEFVDNVYEVKGKYSTTGYSDIYKHTNATLSVSYRGDFILSRLEWKFPAKLSKIKYVKKYIPVRVFQCDVPAIGDLHKIVFTTSSEDNFEANVFIESIVKKGLIGWKEKQFKIEVLTNSVDDDHAIGASLRVIRSAVNKLFKIEPHPSPIIFDIDTLLEDWYLYLIARLRTQGDRYARVYNHCLSRQTAELSLSRDNGNVDLILRYSFNKKEYKKYSKTVHICFLNPTVKTSPI